MTSIGRRSSPLVPAVVAVAAIATAMVAATVTMRVRSGADGPVDAASSAAVSVLAERCGVGSEAASGFIVADLERSDRLVLTTAHHLLRAESVSVVIDDGRIEPAEVLVLDPDRDVAVIRYRPGQPDDATGLTPASADPDGPTAAHILGPGPDGPTSEEATVLRTTAITVDGKGRRRAIELTADIERGQSGSAVIADQGPDTGLVLGMVFAASRDENDRGWAVAASELAATIKSIEPNARALEPSC